MKKIKISELPLSTSLNGLHTIGTNNDGISVKVALEPIDKKASEAINRINERIPTVNEKGFFVADVNGNVVIMYTEEGFDCAMLSPHFLALVGGGGSSTSPAYGMPPRIRICSYNICMYSYKGSWTDGADESDIGNTQFTASNYPAQRARLRGVIDKIGADVLCLQEALETMYNLPDSPVQELFPQYKSHHFYGGSDINNYHTAIVSMLDNVTSEGYGGRDYSYTEIRGTLCGEEVCFVSVHINWRTQSVITSTLRMLADRYKGKAHVAICGDFNIYAKSGGGTVYGSDNDDEGWIMSEYAVFTGNGFTLANWGYLGRLKTAVNNTKCSNAGDNIIVKGFRIAHTETITSLASDHRPLICDLILD